MFLESVNSAAIGRQQIPIISNSISKTRIS